jgi:hypothetical protein
LYKQDLDAKKAARERLEKENTERLQAYSVDKQILEEEEELLKKQKDLQNELRTASLIVTDGSERLQLAIRTKDNIDIDRATILIEGGNTKSKQISEQLSKVTEELIKIQKKRKEKFSHEQQQKRQKPTTD